MQSTVGLFGLLLFVLQFIKIAQGSIIIVEDAKGTNSNTHVLNNIFQLDIFIFIFNWVFTCFY